MSEISWIPGTVVLAVGLIGGLWMALRLRRPAAAAKEGPRVHDLELEIADLEARRDDLYAQLRGADEIEDFDEARALELAAARTLRDLDRARAKLGEVAPKAARARAKKGPAMSAEPAAAPAAPAAAHNPILWFAAGVGFTALVAALIFWAMNDAKPDAMAAAQNASSELPEGHPGDLEGMSPDERARAGELEAELTRNPDNLNARKQLMVLLAQSQQFVEAMKHAEKVLSVDPEDPDGLYISAAVRLTMGRNEEAIALIDRVLARFPDHVLAHLVRGSALLRLGRRDEGREAWEAALQAAGGSSPDIEALIAEEFAGGPAPESAGGTVPAAEDGTPKEYRVAVDLIPGAVVAPGATLFVSVHRIGGGPPAAVKAVRNPKFPLEVTLTQSDSNTGIPLPARGMIVARLDSDGHPGTESPDDLSAEGEGASGELTKFVLW